MSQMAYHWEARFRQRQMDKTHAFKQREAEKQAAEEAAKAELAARHARERQDLDDARKRALDEQIRTRDKSGMKKSYKEREQQLQRLMQERRWHNEMIGRMEKDDKERLYTDAMKDHKSKAKVLRDHGLYRGDATFFLDPEYS